MSVGIGWDLHRLAKGKKFVLGGVVLKSPAGPVGHSDGDVLTHAVIDALLGAAGAGDIGEHFPDSDARWRGASSIAMLRKVVRLLADKGWRVSNVDTIVCLEEPKLMPYKKAIRAKLAGVLGVAPGAVGVKAKTTEGLGPVGQKKAVSASSVALIESRRKK